MEKNSLGFDYSMENLDAEGQEMLRDMDKHRNSILPEVIIFGIMWILSHFNIISKYAELKGMINLMIFNIPLINVLAAIGHIILSFIFLISIQNALYLYNKRIWCSVFLCKHVIDKNKEGKDEEIREAAKKFLKLMLVIAVFVPTYFCITH
jgi:hypothetical protein